jgi:hypothetical protein
MVANHLGEIEKKDWSAHRYLDINGYQYLEMYCTNENYIVFS